jgi:hypothetical protein
MTMHNIFRCIVFHFFLIIPQGRRAYELDGGHSVIVACFLKFQKRFKFEWIEMISFHQLPTKYLTFQEENISMFVEFILGKIVL